MNVALLLLMSPGSTISAGPFLFAFVYSTGRYAAWSAAAFAFCDVSLPAVGDGLPNVGCAAASDVHPSSVTPASRLIDEKSVRAFMSCLP